MRGYATYREGVMSKAIQIIFSVAVLCATGANAATLETQYLRDWTVSCRDNRYCVATTRGQTDAGEKVIFKLERGNKPGSKIFVTTKPDKYTLALGMKVDVSVIGHDYHFFGNVTKVYGGNEMAFIEPFDARTIRKLREGRFARITVEFGGDIGAKSYEISLQGVSSALAMMDIIQGRLDREDAAVVRGGEAMGSPSTYDFSGAVAPPAPAIDDKQAAQRDPEENIDYSAENTEDSALGDTAFTYKQSDINDRILIQGYRVLGCDLPAAIEAFGVQSINLEPGLFLHLVPCHMADVNVPYYGVLENAGTYNLVTFQHSSIEENANPSLLINAAWDRASNTLTGYGFHSSNHDCGSHSRLNLAITEAKFYLSEYRLKENCDGRTSSPENYPLFWSGEGD